MTSSKRLGIILPSYNDARIKRAISSVRRFDDAGIVKLLVIDGGSKTAILDLLKSLLLPADLLLSEPDRGIFDALNKGLELCDTEFIGWLGSDDVFTGNILASEVVRRLQGNDILLTNVAHFRGDFVTRVTHGAPARLGMINYGLNNPHFGTFGTAVLFKTERFRFGLRGADIEYFIKIFAHKPRVVAVNVVSALAEQGGYSTGSYRLMFGSHLALMRVYAAATNWLVAPVAFLVKFAYRVSSVLYFRLFRVRTRDCSDVCRDLL